MSLWPFRRPGDEGLERLRERYAKTLNADLLREEMSGATASGDMDPLDVASVRPRPLGIKKDRFIVLVDVESGGRQIQLVAKGYSDGRARRMIENHRLLWNGGLGDTSAPVRTSRPWGVLEGLGVTLSERLRGEHPPRGDVVSAERLGRAAAFLHACPAALEPRFGLNAALDNLDRHAQSLERREPVLAAGAVRLADRARRLAKLLPATVRGSPIQGDLGRTSFLLDGDRTYLLDWDISCRFDAAWDVGHYLVQLRRSGLVHGVETEAARDRFLSAYLAAAEADAGFPRKVAYHEALVCVHKAYTARRLEGPTSRRVMRELLHVADARLSELE
jgi:Phosphotransferase enzyme family